MYGVKVWNTPVVSEKRVTLKKKKCLSMSHPWKCKGTRCTGLTQYDLSRVHTEKAKYPSAMEVVGMETEDTGVEVKSDDLGRNRTC